MTFGALPTQNEDRPRGLGYGARLGDLWLRLAANRNMPLRVYSRDSLAGREADQSNSYENVLDIGFDFSRSDFSGGEGLAWFPRPSQLDQLPNDSRRYYDSESIDVFGDKQDRLMLARQPEQWYDAGTGGDIEFISASDTSLYVTDGINLQRFDDWSDAGVPVNTFTPGGGKVCYKVQVDSSDAGVLQLDDGSFYFKPGNSPTWNLIENTAGVYNNMPKFWWVKGRCITLKHVFAAGEKYILGELTWDSSYATTTFTAFDTLDADVYEVIDADTAILAISADGKIRSYVPQTDTAGNTPVLTIRGVSPVPGNERAYSIGYNSGKLLFLTAELNEDSTTRHIRAYNGDLLDERFDFVVGNMQLLREWRDTDDEGEDPVLGWPNIVSDRNSFWFKVKETTGYVSIWRQNLATLGLSRYSLDDSTVTDEKIYSLAIWRGRLAWSRWDGKLMRFGDNYQDVGWLITPNINFGINTTLNWMSTTVNATGIRNGEGAQVELWVTTNPDAIDDWQDPAWKLVSRLSNQIPRGIQNPLLETIGTSIALQLRIYNNNVNAGTPIVDRISVRGLPSHRDMVIELPVSVSDHIDVPGRISKRISGYGNEIHKQLLSMLGNHFELRVVEPPVTVRGIVDAIAEPIEYISDRGSVGKVMLIQFRGAYTPAGATSQVTGDQTLGIGLLGVATLGIGQSGVT